MEHNRGRVKSDPTQHHAETLQLRWKLEKCHAQTQHRPNTTRLLLQPLTAVQYSTGMLSGTLLLGPLLIALALHNADVRIHIAIGLA